jgi:hypothetical protein
MIVDLAAFRLVLTPATDRIAAAVFLRGQRKRDRHARESAPLGCLIVAFRTDTGESDDIVTPFFFNSEPKSHNFSPDDSPVWMVTS